MRIFLLTALTMTAFAANSVIGRIALGQNTIDPANYTLIRLASGAVMLAVLAFWQAKASPDKAAAARLITRGNWISAAALFGYAAAFSFAYFTLETGVGALILFASVQATMIGWALIKGDRPLFLEWVGLVTAFGAFIWLVSPGLAAPDPLAAFLMAFSGFTWGVYSLRGKGAADPLLATAGNFARSVPMAFFLMLLMIGTAKTTMPGIVLAIVSGAVTSSLSYVLWYTVLRSLTSTRAAIVQLTVPVIAGIGGLLFLREPWTFRFVVSSVFILGGVAIATLSKAKRIKS